jgi:hypothetical protein
MFFKDFVQLLSLVVDGSDNSKQKKEKRISQLIHYCRAENVDFYPYLRLLLPKLDCRTFGLKEKKLADMFIKILGLGGDLVKALRDFNAPTCLPIARGDFPAALRDVLKTRLVENIPEPLDMATVNQKLDELALYR